MGAESVSIEPRRQGRHEAEWTDGGVRLWAEVGWKFRGSRATLKAVEDALPGLCEWFGDGLLLVEFGNSVGFFDVPGIGRIEVRSGKWGTDHFQRMLREVSAIASALPFSFNRASALPFDRSIVAERDILYHAFVYLRQVISESTGDSNLINAYRVMLSDPHQRLVRGERIVPPDRAGSVGPKALEEIIAGRRPMVRAPSGCSAPLAVMLGGRLPEAVREDFAERFIDTAENRFAKAFIDQALWIVEQMERAIGMGGVDSSNFRARVLADCTTIRSELEPIRQHSFWRRVGPLTILPEGSTVLQKRRGYRYIFEHFSKLRLAARVPLSRDDVEKLLEAKDIATMYELWTFFKVVEAVSSALGPPKKADAVKYSSLSATVEHKYLVEWASGHRVRYNPRFSRQGSGTWRSYSVPLRPDISLRIPTGPSAGLHLLDAKFKIDNLSEQFAAAMNDDDPDHAGASNSGFKRGDLYKMHTYRDAIPSAKSVWILYPGTEVQYFHPRGVGLETSLNALPDEVEGVGGLPLRPEDHGGEDLEGLVAHLLS